MEPTEPELELTVSGVVVDRVKPGDWVLVTCQAKGGHPVADIGLTLDGVPAGSKDFRNFRNSFTFTATQEDNGKTILCTAVNKVGTSAVSTTLHVLGENIIHVWILCNQLFQLPQHKLLSLALTLFTTRRNSPMNAQLKEETLSLRFPGPCLTILDR